MQDRRCFLVLKGSEEMSPKQEKFCLEYAKTGNATQAAEMAGYSEKTAYSIGGRLLKNVEIQKKLLELAEEFKTEKVADVTESLELLTGIARDKKQKGITRVKAIELLLKAQGAFANQQVNLSVTAPVILKDDVRE